MKYQGPILIGVFLILGGTGSANTLLVGPLSAGSAAQDGQPRPIVNLRESTVLFDGPVLTTQKVALEYRSVGKVDIPFRRDRYAVVAVRCGVILSDGRLGDCAVKAAPTGQGYEEAGQSLARNLVVGEEFRRPDRPIKFVYFEATLSNSDTDASVGPHQVSRQPPSSTVRPDEDLVREPNSGCGAPICGGVPPPPPPGPLQDPQLNEKLEHWVALWSSAADRAALDFAAAGKAISKLGVATAGEAERQAARDAILRYHQDREHLRELMPDLEALWLTALGSGSRFDEMRLSNEIEQRRMLLDQIDQQYIGLTVDMLRER